MIQILYDNHRSKFVRIHNVLLRLKITGNPLYRCHPPERTGRSAFHVSTGQIQY